MYEHQIARVEPHVCILVTIKSQEKKNENTN